MKNGVAEFISGDEEMYSAIVMNLPCFDGT